MTLTKFERRALIGLALAVWMAALVPANAAPASTAPPATAPPVSVVKTDALMNALKARHYTAAEALFDERMKAAVPMDQLRQTWEGLVAALGPLVSWTFEAPTKAESME